MRANRDIRLNEMRSLFDLGLFPLSVCFGAVFNVLVTIAITRWVRRSDSDVTLPLWICVVLGANLTPVSALRRFVPKPASYRLVRQMSFFADQHRFPLWVYALASANMAAWVSISWWIFGRPDNPPEHLALLLAAVAATAFPAWIRWFR